MVCWLAKCRRAADAPSLADFAQRQPESPLSLIPTPPQKDTHAQPYL
ncbi:hypothetical protein [Kingella sp. (in: b-proteobacteria)]|nr:hypothetical protein [Kingella sp. (in: b-proteobacteria)]MDO4657953.1 hypothetical protein [Kingella sp. (in: b-proteobacteria)]